MADDLVFPEDDMIGDFDTNFEDLLNIPQLVPPIENMQHSMQRNYSNMHSMNNVNTAPQVNNTGYRPITQLMKQTQELASTLGSPLSSSLNQQMNYNNIINTTPMLNQQQLQQHQNMSNNIPNRLIGNNMNYVNNTNQQKSSQFLVVGGHRIPTQPQQTSAQQHQQTSNQHLSQSSGSPLHAQGSPIFDMASPASLQQQQQNNFKAMSPSSNIQQSVQKIITTNNQPKKAIVLTTPQNQQIQHQQQAQNIQQSKAKPSTPQMISTGTSNSLQQNGVIIKTADQKLMFVTEVNGKKVGYVLPNQKQPSSPNASVTVTVSSLSVTQSNLQQPLVQSNLQKPVQQAAIQNTQKPIQQHQQQTIQNTQKSQLAPSLDSIKPSIQKDDKDTIIKPAAEMTKTLKERLQGLRNNVNNANLRTQLNLNKEKNEKLISQLNNHNASPPTDQRIIQIHTVTQQSNNPVSRIISDFDSTFNNDQSPPPTPPTPTSTLTKNNLNKPAENMNFLEDEEDGQDLEFSENDLTGVQEDSDEPLITSISVPKQNDIEDVTMNNSTNNDDEDSDSLPLSLLKHEEPISIVRENTTAEESTSSKPAKRSRKSQDDSVPLSVVAASLKKDAQQEAPKKKKRGPRKKKDPDEPTKPILAYQLFFREAQQKLKEENPMYKENFGELSRKIGKLWEELEPDKKKVYQQNYQKAKAEYDIKLKEYKEKKALEEAQNEALSPSSSINQNSRDGFSTPQPDDDDEDAPLKKSSSPNKKGGKKKTPAASRPKLTATTIATSSTLSPPLHNFNEESNDSVMDLAADGTETRRKRKYSKKTRTPSADSPSPPSSDTEESEESEEDDAISRIKELAAKAKKQLKKIEKQTKGKGKGKVVKMEVETVSTNITYNDPSPKKVEVASVQPEAMETDETTPEEKPPQATTEPPVTQVMKGPATKNSKAATSKEKVGKVKEKMKTNNSNNIKDEKTNDSAIPPVASPTPKPSFKIPKKTHGENGQVAPQGPRLCVRESCPNPIKVTRERGAQYCSNDCLVLYCREVFDAWVIDRQKEEVGQT